jgi:hypothetical protein
MTTASEPEGSTIYTCGVAQEGVGWTRGPTLSYFTDTGGYTLTSPPLTCAGGPYGFYRLVFRSQAAEPFFYALFFYGEDGVMVTADLYGDVPASPGWQEKTVLCAPRTGAATFTVNFIARVRTSIEDLTVDAVSAETAAGIMDRLDAEMPRVAEPPSLGRWACIPRTMGALRRGEPFHAVMLGDSIVNDTFNSNYGALLARLYPLSRCRISCSVRGSAGCWYYREDANFRAYVLDLKPDLLMIGGIAHREDTDSIRDVIRKTRKRLPGCEILLMTPPAGKDWREGPRDGVTPMPSQTRAPDPFAARLGQLARDEGTAFLDMRTPWDRCLGQSGRPYGWLNRDPVHANDRGRLVIARLLERFFDASELR